MAAVECFIKDSAAMSIGSLRKVAPLINRVDKLTGESGCNGWGNDKVAAVHGGLDGELQRR